MDLAEQNQDLCMQRALKRHLEVGQAVAAEVVGAGATAEAGLVGRSLARKRQNTDKKQMDEFRDKAVHNAAATFWLVSVSLAVFQYLTDMRSVCWPLAPTAALAFELGVPASLLLFYLTAWADPGKAASPPDVGRLCTTTWVLKGARTKYCQRTGACVEEFDHFCGWLNVAVGRGNHRPFIFLAVVESCTQICHMMLCWTA